jgi:hypothetical protein
MMFKEKSSSTLVEENVWKLKSKKKYDRLNFNYPATLNQ